MEHNDRSSKARTRLRHGSVPRLGFTLFELILAIALSSIVLLMLGAAVRLHMRALDIKRTQVEQSHLARAILRQISMELRGTVNTALLTADDKSAAVTSSVGQLASQNTANQGATGNTTTSATTGQVSGDQSVAVAAPTTPGLYGTATELHFDVNRGRPPFLSGGLDPMLAATGQPSGQLQRISYYVGPLPTTGMVMSSMPTVDPAVDPSMAMAMANGGLIRRAVDHAIAEWSLLNASTNVDMLAQVLAPEVVAIEFRYFDGLQWLTAWDSQQQAGLPAAVEITLAVANPLSEDELSAYGSTGLAGLSTPLAGYSGVGMSPNAGVFIYQTTVSLPAALPTSQTQTATQQP